jgi:protein phosphatase
VTIGVKSGAVTHVGLVRDENQDAILAESPVFVVADGMGGQAGGEVAAALAVAEFARFRYATAVHQSSVIDAIHAANAQIRLRASQDPLREDMGTTVTGLALTRHGTRDALLVFNVGDSRTYRYRAGTLTQVSADHSVVADFLRAGELTMEEARAHPHRHVVTRALGAEEVVLIDTWVIEPEAGDRYLLCSDGLTNELRPKQILQTLAPDSGPQAVAERLVELALGAGGRDNVSVVVIEIESCDLPDPEVDEETDPRFGASADTLPPPPGTEQSKNSGGLITGLP